MSRDAVRRAYAQGATNGELLLATAPPWRVEQQVAHALGAEAPSTCGAAKRENGAAGAASVEGAMDDVPDDWETYAEEAPAM